MKLQKAARWVAIAAGVEAATGLVLVVRPLLFTGLLFGAELPPVGQALGRLAGFALLALAVACWPGGEGQKEPAAPILALFLFSLLAAVYLAYLAVVRDLSGPLLWPAAVLHLFLAILLARSWLARVR